MPKIRLLEQSAIDKIAAGEVVERPASVVKELVENAIDAGASAVTVEIKDGGISFIRITDNGCGIDKDEISMAFLRHSTSKIQTAEDLARVSSLGFRGEALSSIAAVSKIELITRPASSMMGTRFLMEGSKEVKSEDVGAPEGTTFLVRDLFYNTPARQKFLKTPQTEASYISDFMERLALSRPDISFQFIVNGQPKLTTSGNGELKEVVYRVYGRDIAANLIEVHAQNESMTIDGFLGKPLISRGNRNFESCFINGRYIRSNLLAKAVEDAYRLHLMQRQYPFAVLNLKIDTSLIDVNVHPAKMELRFSNGREVYEFVTETVSEHLSHRELIPEASVGPEPAKKSKKSGAKEQKNMPLPEPFEKKRRSRLREESANAVMTTPDDKTVTEKMIPKPPEGEQLTLRETFAYEKQFLERESRASHRIIGQLFDTYWLIEFEDKLFIIDQHAAHEKVLFERMMRDFERKEFTSQQLSPPMVVSLNMAEEGLLKKYQEEFKRLGYEITPFGGKEYAVCAVPGNLYGLNEKHIFLEMLDALTEEGGAKTGDAVIEKIASMSCKAAVKGNQRLSRAEVEKLIEELLSCENPYQCPHGRPTIISMTRYELEKKFKRIV